MSLKETTKKDYNDYDNKRCYICKKYFEMKNLNIIKHKQYQNQYLCKRCAYLLKGKKYGFKGWREFEEWYVKQWNYQLGCDSLGKPLPNPNPCPEWRGGACVDHDHISGKVRGLCSNRFNTSINMLFEYKSPKERQRTFDIICQWLDGTWKPNPEINKKYLQQQEKQKELEKLVKVKKRYKKTKINKNPRYLFYWLNVVIKSEN